MSGGSITIMTIVARSAFDQTPDQWSVMETKTTMTKLRVGVVGAGPAGLCAARHCISSGMECTVFEQTGDIGGIWQYTDCVGTDQYGIPVHTSMYTNLRINLPKDIVVFPGFPHQENPESYLTSEEILQYLHDYVAKYRIRQHCKFYHHVEEVRRTGSEWEVAVVDLPSSQRKVYRFDAIFICNGLNNKPLTPHVEGAERFSGTMIHSHDYRIPEPFSGQKVLIIGGGASALDLADHISKVADKVWFSTHSERFRGEDLKLRKNVIYKTGVASFRSDSAVFRDGTEEEVDAVVYCTGYRCNYSFLHESCGVTEDEGVVFPLYKHFINANQTTMCILGNLYFSIQLPTFDFQARVFVEYLMNRDILPDREGMLQDIADYTKKKLENGVPKKAFFTTTSNLDKGYYDTLGKMAGVEPLPKVLFKIHQRALAETYANFPLFRGDKYKIIDDDTFVFNSPE